MVRIERGANRSGGRQSGWTRCSSSTGTAFPWHSCWITQCQRFSKDSPPPPFCWRSQYCSWLWAAEP